MKLNPIRLTAATLLALAWGPCAWAHPGHAGAAGGFVAGVFHPISGVDHVLTMLAVGLYAAGTGRRASWLLPVTFIGCMVGGAALGLGGMSVPWIEQAIGASVLIIGLMIATRVRLGLPAACGLVGLFAIFHGYAHGSEMRPGVSWVTYLAGFTLTTGALLVGGVGLGRMLTRWELGPVVRWIGTAVAMSGIVLLTVT